MTIARTVIDGLPACKLTCSEAEAIAAVLRSADEPDLADRFLREHGDGDTDSEDEHHDMHDPEHVCPSDDEPETPRVEVVIMRDSDSALDSWVYLDGVETDAAEVTVVDNGADDLSDDDTRDEWLRDRREDAEGASPAVAELILSLAGDEADSH